MSRIEQLAEGVTLYLGDCREIATSLDNFDMVTDPPYGLGDKWRGGTKKWRLADNGRGVAWDSETSAFVSPLVKMARYSIVWGGNYYVLPPSRGWLIWDKKSPAFHRATQNLLGRISTDRSVHSVSLEIS